MRINFNEIHFNGNYLSFTYSIEIENRWNSETKINRKIIFFK